MNQTTLKNNINDCFNNSNKTPVKNNKNRLLNILEYGSKNKKEDNLFELFQNKDTKTN